MSSYRFIPGPRLPWVMACTLPLLLLGENERLAALVIDLWLLAMALLEARRAAKLAPEVTRSLPARLLLGVTNVVGLSLANPHPRPVRGTLRDAAPDAFGVEPSELEIALPPHGRKKLDYEVFPAQRGRFAFGDVHLRLEGPLGLGSALVRIAAPTEARVYPNLRGPRRYELAARLGALHSVGVRAARRIGGGGEFEQLREYVPGDSFHDLDWKATAKRGRPITRLHGQEQSQTVIVALDAGRMMALQSGELTKLDHAINAALLLVWVALRSGDRVGLVVFAERVLGFVPPARGLAQYRR
ncbi:MAG TPA: DUF58 domain-containing protein, partial [Polyangiales bacterium]|nr:DUF58 domain-containing protein [Polyangiales bacterium]